MKLLVTPFKRLFSIIWIAASKKELLLQRLFWGALLGYVSSFLLAGLPYLENMESSMLEWRYKLADKDTWVKGEYLENFAKDIRLIVFDDQSQFELGIARFNDLRSQDLLAKAIDKIESFSPKMVVLDVDIRGANCATLVKVMQRYHNIVIGLFGNLEGNSNLPPVTYLTNAAAFGYDELLNEPNGTVRELPISYRALGSDASHPHENTVVPVPSLTEAVVNLNRRINGSGTYIHHLVRQRPGPLYSSFRKFSYESTPLVDVLQNRNFNPTLVKNEIVIIGDTLTPRVSEIGGSITHPLSKLYIHANAISTLLNNEQLYTFSSSFANSLILLLGASFCAITAILNFIPRSLVLLISVISLLFLSQISFQIFHTVIPTAPPLAVLIMCYAIGTFINLNTDLRVRNKELARARESMQMRAEEERQRIAEDLHDETLPNLSAVARMADKLSKELVDNPIPSQMRERLDSSVSEMRRVIDDLHPSVLETMGFKSALENLLAKLSRDNTIETHFNDNSNFNDEALPKLYKLQLYRIVQECLNNIQKHAQATKVQVQIVQRGDQILVLIVDNGKGMPASSSNKESHGIVNIKQRAQLIGAKVSWKQPATFSSGTEVRVELPLAENMEGEKKDEHTNS